MSLQWICAPGVLRLRQGDITQARVQAVVNAANAQLAGGGGVDGAIHRAAGQALLQAACRDIIARRGPLKPGEAALTPGFGLKAPWIIHAVGPIWRGGRAGEETALAQAYGQSLALAREQGLASVAFPALSCGAYGFPVARAAPIALGALRRGLEAGLVVEAELWLHGAAAFETWADLAKDILGPAA
jgi:O-acetyl-ADP-ribose deacetylase (regulator of RNase III)